MFGKNEIVGKKFFKEAGGKFFVTTLFPTLQGEGPYAGLPAIFIRLAKCNLACSFCDTYFDDGDWYTKEELLLRVGLLVPNSLHYKKNIGIVISGGEPSLQNLKDLTTDLNNEYKWVQIESNGILEAEFDWRTTLVISPKCVEKGGKAIKYIMPHEKMLTLVDCFKFVITADPDSVYHTIPDWAFKTQQDYGIEIYISPMNMYLAEPKAVREKAVKNRLTLEERSVINETISFWEDGLLDRKANQKNHEYAAQYCLRNGLRLNLQQHLYASLP